MSEHSELKEFLKTSKNIIPEDERERIAREPLNEAGQGEFVELKTRMNEHMQENLQPDQIAGFLDLISGKGEHHPEYLVELGGILREYGSKSETGRVLNEKERHVVSLGIKYFENWMYRGGPVIEPNYVHNFSDVKKYDYLAVAAFLVNQLAKIKDRPEHQDLYSFDKERLKNLFDEVDALANSYFNGDASFGLDSESSRLRVERAKLNEDIFDLDRQLREIMVEAKGELTEFTGDRVAHTGNEAHAIMAGMCSPFVIRKMLDASISLGKAIESVHGSDVYNAKRFLVKKDTDTTVQSVNKGELRNFAFGGVGEKYKDTERKSKVLSKQRDGIDQELKDRDQASAVLKKVNTDLLKRETDLSRSAIKRKLREKASADLYFLKDVIIASEILRRKGQNYAIDLSLPPVKFDKAEPVFNFNDTDIFNTQISYRQVHYFRSYMRYAQMTAIYLKGQVQKKSHK